MNEHQPVFDRRDPRQYQCKHEGEINALLRRDEAISTKLDQILAQVNRIAVLEEKHSNQSVDLLRAHEKIGKLEQAVEELARESREFIAYSKGVAKILWAIGGAVALLGVKILFFTAAHGMTP